MSTVRTVTFDYSESPAQVAALLTDPAYLRQRSESNGERNIEIRLEKSEAGTRVIMARDRPLHIKIPAFAKAAVENASRAIENTLWHAEGDRWVADYTIDVPGMPIGVRGQSVLAPTAVGCKYTSTFEVTARIPLFASKVESMVADGFVEQLMLNTQRNADALKRRAQHASPTVASAIG
jgi:hypothetical protein